MDADGKYYASFLDLVDLLVVKKFTDRNFPLQKIRKFLQEVRNRFGMEHFAHNKFFSDGKNVYLDYMRKKIKLLSGGQLVDWGVFEKLSEEIVFDPEIKWALQWYPLGMDNFIVVDPMISFGRPTVIKKGVPTSTIYSLYLAEDKNINAPLEWHDLSEDEVKAAVEFEERLAA